MMREALSLPVSFSCPFRPGEQTVSDHLGGLDTEHHGQQRGRLAAIGLLDGFNLNAQAIASSRATGHWPSCAQETAGIADRRRAMECSRQLAIPDPVVA